MTDFVSAFRQIAPYVHGHRDKTFVISMGGEAIRSKMLPALVGDISMLHALGIRIVLVVGSRPQIDRRLKETGHTSRVIEGTRVTDERALAAAKEAAGINRVELERLFSVGMAGTTMGGARIRVASGNFVSAKPFGVIDGVDYGYAGRVRRIDTRAINDRLADECIVVLTPLGYSVTGECFNLNTPELAADAAIALRADKLICLMESEGIRGARNKLITELTSAEAGELLEGTLQEESRIYVTQAKRSIEAGVARAHLLGRKTDGVLVRELFTRDGTGTLVTNELYEGVRPARLRDVPSILQILEPLEAAGVLVHRSRELLEEDIERFFVVERDGLVMGCAALYAFPPGDGELACLAVRPEFREAGRGEVLVYAVERRAREEGLTRLFVLTTQSAHFFVERGYKTARPKDLPASRKRYDRRRKSKVLVKNLE